VYEHKKDFDKLVNGKIVCVREGIYKIIRKAWTTCMMEGSKTTQCIPSAAGTHDHIKECNLNVMLSVLSVPFSLLILLHLPLCMSSQLSTTTLTKVKTLLHKGYI